MNNWFLIPLQGIPESFQIALAGVNYVMSIYWNDSPDAGWLLDLTNADTNTMLVSAVPLITGADLLANLGYLGVGGSLFVLTNGNPAAVPLYTNLGTNCNLFFVTTT